MLPSVVGGMRKAAAMARLEKRSLPSIAPGSADHPRSPFGPGKRQFLTGAGKGVHIPASAFMKNAVAIVWPAAWRRRFRASSIGILFLPGEARREI